MAKKAKGLCLVDLRLKRIYAPARGLTLREAADEFAGAYWDGPRRVTSFAAHTDANGDHFATFSVVGGTRSYVVSWDPIQGTHHVSQVT